MAQGTYYTTCVMDKDCHWDFFHKALGAADFPSRTVCCGNRDKLSRWRVTLQSFLKAGETRQNS